MNHNKWYISSAYDYESTDIIAEIIKALKVKEHRVLFGYKFYYLSELPKNILENIMDTNFNLYNTNLLYLGNITDIDELERRMRSVLLKKYNKREADIALINDGKFSINELLEKFTNIDEKTLYDLKYTLTESIHPTSDIVKAMFTEDKIRFKGVPDKSLTYHYKLYSTGTYIQLIDFHIEPVYTWLEINLEDRLEQHIPMNDLKSLVYNCFGDLHLIITDDLQDISKFTYYVNTFWSSEFGVSVAVNDNRGRLSELADTKLVELCGEERRFVKWSDEDFNALREKIDGEKDW